jgi:hypothetical protein
MRRRLWTAAVVPKISQPAAEGSFASKRSGYYRQFRQFNGLRMSLVSGLSATSEGSAGWGESLAALALRCFRPKRT